MSGLHIEWWGLLRMEQRGQYPSGPTAISQLMLHRMQLCLSYKHALLAHPHQHILEIPLEIQVSSRINRGAACKALTQASPFCPNITLCIHVNGIKRDAATVKKCMAATQLSAGFLSQAPHATCSRETRAASSCVTSVSTAHVPAHASLPK